MDEFVSRSHAEVVFHNSTYFLKDLGSGSGTFIRINDKRQIHSGMIIEMGSNQFEVEIGIHAILSVIEGPNSGE